MTDSLAKAQDHRLIASNRVEGTNVYDRAGEKLGSIYNFMVDKRSGKAEYAVMQFGGILGIGSDYYPIPWDLLDYDPQQGGYVVDLTKEQIDKAPSYQSDEPSFDTRYGQAVYGYYGLPYPFI